MDPTDPPRAARRSAGEWLFQLTTITIGVLIALSFDALLRWNADRTLVEEAHAMLALELADNRREIDEHLATYSERTAMIDTALKLVGELDAGVEPTVREVNLSFSFPSLSDAAWQTATGTGAIALMEYAEVQDLAGVYTLQSLFMDTAQPTFLAANDAGAMMTSNADPLGMPPPARESFRARLIQLKAYLELSQQLGQQLSQGYSKLDR
jgi:hypothetical protein